MNIRTSTPYLSNMQAKKIIAPMKPHINSYAGTKSTRSNELIVTYVVVIERWKSLRSSRLAP